MYSVECGCVCLEARQKPGYSASWVCASRNNPDYNTSPTPFDFARCVFRKLLLLLSFPHPRCHMDVTCCVRSCTLLNPMIFFPAGQDPFRTHRSEDTQSCFTFLPWGLKASATCSMPYKQPLQDFGGPWEGKTTSSSSFGLSTGLAFVAFFSDFQDFYFL